MHLRKLESHDFEQWMVLWKEYLVFYQTGLAEQQSELTFKRLIDLHEPMGCFVLEEGQNFVGFVHYIFHKSTWTEGDYCYLQDLYVKASYRSHGLGKKLIEAVYTEAAQKQCSRVYWLTQENNQTARKLYDHVAQNTGFIQYRKNLK